MQGNSGSDNQNASGLPVGGAGQPLSPPVRHRMETQFGADFCRCANPLRAQPGGARRSRLHSR
jgi:hypothetical protein